MKNAEHLSFPLRVLERVGDHDKILAIADELFAYPLSSLPADPSPYDATAHPGGLKITVGGQAVPSAGWAYDAVRNAVIFDPAAAPPAGASLTVAYALGCGG